MLTYRKRNLFDELTQGIKEIKDRNTHKITLRTHTIEKKAQPKIDANFIRRIREELHMSRNVFALRLRVSPRTLEKWELGTTVPNDQAATLILMVHKYPDMLQRLGEV